MHMTRCLNGALAQIGRGVSTCEVAKLVDEGKLKPLIHEQRFTFDEINNNFLQKIYSIFSNTIPRQRHILAP